MNLETYPSSTASPSFEKRSALRVFAAWMCLFSMLISRLVGGETHTATEIPGGSPIAAKIPGSDIDDGAAVVAVEHGDAGEIYLLGSKGGLPYLTIYNDPNDPEIGPVRIKLNDTPDFKLTGFAVAGDLAFASGVGLDNVPHLIRVSLASESVEEEEAPFGFNANYTINDIAVQKIGAEVFVFVCGTIKEVVTIRIKKEDETASRTNRKHYWKKLDANTFAIRDEKEWKWRGEAKLESYDANKLDEGQSFNLTPETGASTYTIDTTQANSDVTAIALDESGNVYVSGFWAPSGPNLLKRLAERNDNRVASEMYDNAGGADGHIRGQFIKNGMRWVGNVVPLKDYTSGDLADSAIDEAELAFGAIHRPEVAYIAKFKFDDASEEYMNTQYIQDSPYETKSRIKDLQVFETDGGEYLYALQEYSGRGELGSNQESKDFTRGTKGSVYNDKLVHYIGDGDAIHANQVTVGLLPAVLKDEAGSGFLGRDIKIDRFGLNLEETEQKAVIQSAGTDLCSTSLTVDAFGNVIVAGLLPDESSDVSFVDSSGISDPALSYGGESRIFVATLDSTFAWKNRLILGKSSTYDRLSPALVQWLPHPDHLKTLVAGNFQRDDGSATDLILQNDLDDPEGFEEEPPRTTIEAPAGKNVGFFAFIDRDGKFAEQHFLTVESEFGESETNVRPWKGKEVAEFGLTYTVEVPKHIYVDGAGAFLGSLDVPPDAANIESNAKTRYTNTGYTVADTEIIGDSNSYTFVFKEDTKITFHWKVEHALEVKTDFRGTGAVRVTGTADEWNRGADGRGLTSLASGNPLPEIKKHWIGENELVTLSIDGVVPDFRNFGVRYRALGVRVEGAAAEDLTLTDVMSDPDTGTPIEGHSFGSPPELRPTIAQFAMSGPAVVEYLWGVQYRVQVSASSANTFDLPEIRTTTSTGLNAGDIGKGIGEHWFDEGETIHIGSLLTGGHGTTPQTLRGWSFADGGPFRTAGINAVNNTALSTEGTFRYLPPGGYAIDEPITVSWNYDDPIYRISHSIEIGSAFDLATEMPAAKNGSQVPTELSIPDYMREGRIGSGAIRPPDEVTVVQSPNGSTSATMQAWDQAAHVTYPLRPGRFFLAWRENGEDYGSSRIVVEIESAFPAEPHYRHVTHPEMPAVDLDPDSKDAFHFLDLKYSQGNSAIIVDGGLFASEEEGRHVLVFSQSTTNEPATGDLTQETLVVRVAETRRWDSTPGGSDGGLGSWDNSVDEGTDWILTTDDANPFSTDSATFPIIGRKLADDDFDSAQIGTGFVVHTQARYNLNIYDRSKVADAGPIIPVNQHFTGLPQDDLVVVWYEHYRNEGDDTDDPLTEPSNILWPWQSVSYPSAEWPPEAATDRIVIASRLGSDGKNARGEDQLVFFSDRYEDIKIYHQPVIGLTGYNPNEEHALLAPSFKYLDQANPPLAAYALQDGAFNIIAPDGTHTSLPRVLVEYLDKGTITLLEGTGQPLAAAGFLEPGITSENVFLSPLIGTVDNPTFIPGAAFLLNGELIEPAGLTADDFVAAVNAVHLKTGITASVTEDNTLRLDAREESKMKVYRIEREDPTYTRTTPYQFPESDPDPDNPNDQRAFPYVFDYNMKAGEPVQPPYPLGLVTGGIPCKETWGKNGNTSYKTYWEDFRGQPWAISEGNLFSYYYYPMQVDFWAGEGSDAIAPGTCLPFLPPPVNAIDTRPLIIAGEVPAPTGEMPAEFVIYGQTVTIEDLNADGKWDADEFVSSISPSFSLIGVDETADTLSIESGTGLEDGSRIRLSSSGLLPAGLDAPTHYYIVRNVTESGGEVAFTLEDSDGNSIDIEDGGTGLHQLSLLKIDGLTDDLTMTASIRSADGRLQLEVHDRDPVTLFDEDNSPLAAAGIYSGVRTKSAFLVIGTASEPELEAGDKFTLNSLPIEVTDQNGDESVDADDLVMAVNEAFVGDPNISASRLLTGEIRIQSADRSELEFDDGIGRPLLAAGITDGVHQAGPVLEEVVTVKYHAQWPDGLPVLKLGETLTFAGGEYRADHPENRGLPGVLGWASGEVLFDSLNPAMDNQLAFTQYAARLISPLETLSVPVSNAEALEFEIQPATGITRVDGTVWRFEDLPASLGKRVFYDPLDDALGIQGFLNDKTLGDGDLTAAPPPVYVLEGNILTPSERTLLEQLEGPDAVIGWKEAVRDLFARGRNPEGLRQTPTIADEDGYYSGLELDVDKDSRGEAVVNPDGSLNTIDHSARPKKFFGPGLALVPSPSLLDPRNPLDPSEPNLFERGYVTLVENNDADIGGPVTIHIVKLEKKHRFRGAIKTILAKNIFAEQITLRHSGDFGGNSDDIVYQWYSREEDGTTAPLPPNSPWRLFLDQSDSPLKGLGKFQIDLAGTGGLLLADNLFFMRYRHKNDVPEIGFNKPWAPSSAYPEFNGVDWRGLEWERFGQEAAVLDKAAKPLRDENGKTIRVKAGEWAGAANSPSVDKVYIAQLASGWIKRILDRINPYEARFDDFRTNEAPATYVSMIQQAGRPFEGPVALNSDKNIVENVGLLELYHTLIQRATDLSIGLSSPITTPGINTALTLGATRISDIYMLMGNEAFSDAIDPTIGIDYGTETPFVFTFQNQLDSLLDEELALLRGVNESFGRPVYNRLFWNFTKGEGEVAYAVNYDIPDVNHDGFINEEDALQFYPQGHGDAWGHYLSALKSHYDLLRHPFFNWISRTERYNLLDVTFDVDFLDERKFAAAAAAKAKAGAEIVDLTYRDHYVDEPDGQWQGYTDTMKDRAWGVQGWARRAGQGAYLDWLTANAILPSDFDTFNDSRSPRQRIEDPNPLQRIDRKTVSTISGISANLGKIQNTYDDANNGLNPLGLARDGVPFDIRAAALNPNTGYQKTHFEQIYARAEQAFENAKAAFAAASRPQNRLRNGLASAEKFAWDVEEQDRSLRNRLIEVFGTPYAGVIGPGKPFPAGYSGPDLGLWMYVDVKDVDNQTVPPPTGKTAEEAVHFGSNPDEAATEGADGTFKGMMSGFPQMLLEVDGARFGDEDGVIQTYFDNTFAFDKVGGITNIEFINNERDQVFDLPIRASGYAFQAPRGAITGHPEDWGRRQSTGELQSIIQDLVQAEADLLLAIGDYDFLLADVNDQMKSLEAKHGWLSELLGIEEAKLGRERALKAAVKIAESVKTGLKFGKSTLELGNKTVINGTIKLDGKGTTTIQDLSPATIPINKLHQSYSTAIENVIIGLDEGIADATAIHELANSIVDFELKEGGFGAEIKGALKELEKTLRDEGTLRIAIFKKQEVMRQISDRYRTTVAKGISLLDERQAFNQRAAGITQKRRYEDMAFRIFRNGALQGYRSSFDLAQRYAYLAAQAYDYETNLDPNDPASARQVVNSIISARHLGTGGLGTAMGALKANYDVLKGRLGLDSPQEDHLGSISLRNEMVRVKPDGTFVLAGDENADAASAVDTDGVWSQYLEEQREENLWNLAEFRRYCRPPAAQTTGPQPGIVIPFSTEIVDGNNFFGWPLGAGDKAYNPTNYATKVRAVGVWFEGYDITELAFAPEVYLVPAGLDVMTVPNSPDLATRTWKIVDQAIPVPFPQGEADLLSPNWIPVKDSLDGPFAEIRRFSSFRANWTPSTQTASDAAELQDDEMVFDTRLVGRSIWNTKWLLIIRGNSLLADGDEGLDAFIDRVTDIKVGFKTYGYSGN